MLGGSELRDHCSQDGIRLVFDDGKAYRPFLEMYRNRPSQANLQGSVYLHPVVDSPAYVAWDQPLVARGTVGPGLHFSAHATGRVNLRQSTTQFVSYQAVPLHEYEAPNYVLTILTPNLEYYPAVRDLHSDDAVIDVKGVRAGFAVHVAVGPDLTGRVPANKIRISYPGVTAQSVVQQIVTGVRPPLYFAAAVATAVGPSPTPLPVEAWAPIEMATTADYLPRPAVPYRPDPI